MAEDLRVPGERIRDRLEPVGVAMVQLGSEGLGDRAVGRLLDEDVAEAVLLPETSAGRPALHQALGHEGLEVAAERRTRLDRKQVPDFLFAEVLADDGGPDENAAGS